MAIKNYNRIIDLKLRSKGGIGLAPGIFQATETIVRCPRKGRKPAIEISGTMSSNDVASQFELRIKNFYNDRLLANLSQIEVTAGYENSSVAVFTGTPLNVYTADPGPDRTSIIQCAVVNYSDWTSQQVKLSLDPGFTISDVVNKISQALKFDAPVVAADIQTTTSQVRWDFVGTAKTALHKLTRDFFPDTSALIANNRITIHRANGKNLAYKKSFNIPFLSSAPQFSGDAVTITAPWNPAIKPGDRVSFSSKFYQAQASEQLARIKDKTEIEVVTINFEFSTTNGRNSMTIMGITGGNE